MSSLHLCALEQLKEMTMSNGESRTANKCIANSRVDIVAISSGIFTVLRFGVRRTKPSFSS